MPGQIDNAYVTMSMEHARQGRLDREHKSIHERRAAEQPEARWARIDRQYVCGHECRVVEQPEARQLKLER